MAAAADEFILRARSTSHRDLLEPERLVLLIICTKPDGHCAIALDAFTMGADVSARSQ